MKTILRYSTVVRLNHWLVALCALLLAASGLALFHPAFYFLTALLGGGTWARILHPFIGVVMALAFLGMVARVGTYNHLTAADRQWLRQIGDLLANHEERLPPAGRFNAGQKLIYWLMLAMLAVLLVSGIALWQPWFAGYFPAGLRRLAAVAHAAGAFLLLAGLIVHIYAALWVSGSLHAMLTGSVTPAWARRHHPAWYRQITGGE